MNDWIDMDPDCVHQWAYHKWPSEGVVVRFCSECHQIHPDDLRVPSSPRST